MTATGNYPTNDNIDYSLYEHDRATTRRVKYILE